MSKTEEETGNRVAMISSDRDAEMALHGDDTNYRDRGYIPELLRMS